MPGWTPFGDWMHFRYLDGGNANLEGAFTVGYRITDDAGEAWTTRFNRFKAKNLDAFSGGSQMILGGVPNLLNSLGVSSANAVFVPALSSGETTASPKGQMSLMAKACADATGARFVGNALSKQVHNPIHGIFNAAERDAELDKAGYASTELPGNIVFVFDDFITRGSTQGRIASAVRAANPNARVFGVALAKTDRRSWWPNLSNAHVAKSWDDGWLRGEQAYRDSQMRR
jgi:hypothetical protein